MTGDGEIVYMECQSLPHASCRTFMVADKLVQPLLDEGKKVCITIKPEEIFRLRGPVKPAINARSWRLRTSWPGSITGICGPISRRAIWAAGCW